MNYLFLPTHPKTSLITAALLSLLMVSGQPSWSADAKPAGKPKEQAVFKVSSVGWQEFLKRHDLVWETLPKEWEGGAFLGNGLVGAMIYSDGTNALQWDVGRTDVVDRGGRIPIGRFVLETPSPTSGGTMRMDLWNAEARGSLFPKGTHAPLLEWRSFTHTDRPVTIIDLEEKPDTPPAKLSFRHLAARSARDDFKKIPIPKEDLNPEPSYGESNGISWCLQPFKVGGGYTVAWGEKTVTPGKREFAFTVDFTASGIPNPDKAVKDVRSALAENEQALVQSHRDWWHAYYPQSFLSIPDTRMESFYWIQMYKLASATRTDRPALDLMGPWFRATPWPKIWWNLNLQLTYWPVYAANRLALGESMTRMIDTGMTNLIANVPLEWSNDSAAIARTSSYDCVGKVDPKEHKELGNLLWALHNYWLQYRYCGDEKMLKERLYPLLSRAVGLYLHLLTPGPDGKLHLPVSISPEYKQSGPDTNYDLSLLRWGLQTLLATDERLGLNDPQAAVWKKTLTELTPFPVDPFTGYMIADGVPFLESHRHYSHLFMIYPLHLVDPTLPSDRPLIEKSFGNWTANQSGFRGFSYTGAGAMSAWMGRGDDAANYLNTFLEFRNGRTKLEFPIRANTLYTEAGPVIETPLSGASTLHEMLLQSWSQDPFGTCLRIFPAVPASWKDVSFDKLLAEGAFEVSAVRRGGRTLFVKIKSLAGSPCRVVTDLDAPIKVTGDRAFKTSEEKSTDGQRVVTIDLHKGETILLTSAAHPIDRKDLNIEPVATQKGMLNFYGSPKPDPQY